MRSALDELGRCVVLGAMVGWHGSVAAQPSSYPAKSIRVIVAQSPGSASDIVARIVGQQMSTLLGQSLIIDTRPGAGGVTGAEIAARTAPDGYTVLITTISTHGTVPALYRKLSFDPIKDFTPIGLWVTIPNILVVHPSLPVKGTQELVALAKARPGQLNVGMQGNGSSQHLATELFKQLAGGLNVVQVPYKGSGPMIIALVTGEITLLFPTLSLSRPHIQAGKVRAIAVTTAERITEFPDLPPVGDTVPGFEFSSWSGLHAPAGTAREIVTRLNEAAGRALAMPEVRKSLANSGMTATPSTPEHYGNHVDKEIAKWTKVARAANIEAQ
jgi:tripartite-type tricarboxylate transporter receptor subunit TctC